MYVRSRAHSSISSDRGYGEQYCKVLKSILTHKPIYWLLQNHKQVFLSPCNLRNANDKHIRIGKFELQIKSTSLWVLRLATNRALMIFQAPQAAIARQAEHNTDIIIWLHLSYSEQWICSWHEYLELLTVWGTVHVSNNPGRTTMQGIKCNLESFVNECAITVLELKNHCSPVTSIEYRSFCCIDDICFRGDSYGVAVIDMDIKLIPSIGPRNPIMYF